MTYSENDRSPSSAPAPFDGGRQGSGIIITNRVNVVSCFGRMSVRTLMNLSVSYAGLIIRFIWGKFSVLRPIWVASGKSQKIDDLMNAILRLVTHSWITVPLRPTSTVFITISLSSLPFIRIISCITSWTEWDLKRNGKIDLCNVTINGQNSCFLLFFFASREKLPFCDFQILRRKKWNFKTWLESWWQFDKNKPKKFFFLTYHPTFILLLKCFCQFKWTWNWKICWCSIASCGPKVIYARSKDNL